MCYKCKITNIPVCDNVCPLTGGEPGEGCGRCPGAVDGGIYSEEEEKSD